MTSEHPTTRPDLGVAEACQEIPPGKARAFMPLYAAARRAVYAYVFSLLPSRADADDVFQEASLVMWEKFDPDQPPQNFVAWGCKIAYLKVLQHRKNAYRRQAVLRQDVFDLVSEAAEARVADPASDDRREALAACLTKLPPHSRDLLTVWFETGGKAAAVIARTGRSADAIYQALSRIRQALAGCVARATGGD